MLFLSMLLKTLKNIFFRSVLFCFLSTKAIQLTLRMMYTKALARAQVLIPDLWR